MVETMILAATSADVPAITAIAEAAYAPYVARMGRKPAPMVADFAAHVDRGEAYVLKAGGIIAAYLITYEKDGGQFIENVAVDPARHGQGLGRCLMAFAEMEAADVGRKYLFLYTNVHMTENLDFYPKLGYVETHRVFEGGFDRVYFEKRLSP